jgi:N-methylhydantoinase B
LWWQGSGGTRHGNDQRAVLSHAVNGRTSTCQRAADLVIGALAQAAPERCIAAVNGSCTTASFAGIDPHDGHLWVYLETIGGGSGTRASKDGLDGVHVHMTNTSNLPVEALEVEYPLTVLRYELVDGSGGPGRFRGGMELRRVYRAEAECQSRLDGSRLVTPPWGLNGGHSGGRGVFRFGEGVEPFVNRSGRLRAGEIVEIITPGAGGYGASSKCDPAVVVVVETARRWIELEWLQAARAAVFTLCRQSFLASG